MPLPLPLINHEYYNIVLKCPIIFTPSSITITRTKTQKRPCPCLLRKILLEKIDCTFIYPSLTLLGRTENRGALFGKHETFISLSLLVRNDMTIDTRIGYYNFHTSRNPNAMPYHGANRSL